MSEFLAVSLSYPTLVLSVLLLIAVVFWVISLLGLATDGGDADLDTGVGGGGGDVLAFLRLDGAPVTISLTVWTLAAWFCCFVLTSLLDLDAPGNAATVALATLVLLGSVAAGLVPTIALARPLARAVRRFADTGTAAGSDVLGRTCRITTGRVTADFGQAVVTLADGTTDTIQVRTGEQQGGRTGGQVALGYDSVALLLEYDPQHRTYVVQPAPAFLGGAADPDRGGQPEATGPGGA